MRQPGNKYLAVSVEIDGYRFASGAEGRRYQELKLLEKAGEIVELQVHPKFPFDIRGHHVCTYVSDFLYKSSAGVLVVEDVKSAPTRTALYKLKKKLLFAIYGLEVKEVP